MSSPCLSYLSLNVSCLSCFLSSVPQWCLLTSVTKFILFFIRLLCLSVGIFSFLSAVSCLSTGSSCLPSGLLYASLRNLFVIRLILFETGFIRLSSVYLVCVDVFFDVLYPVEVSFEVKSDIAGKMYLPCLVTAFWPQYLVCRLIISIIIK